MDEPIDAPKPPSDLSEDATEVVDQLPPKELRSLIKYAGARLRHLETPISELVEAGEGEELVRVEDKDLYTVVVKGKQCAEGCQDCPHDPDVYIVTLEWEPDGSRHLHWRNIGKVVD